MGMATFDVEQQATDMRWRDLEQPAVWSHVGMRNSDSHASIRMSLIIHEMTPRVRRHVIRLLSRCYVYVRQHGGDYLLLFASATGKKMKDHWRLQLWTKNY